MSHGPQLLAGANLSHPSVQQLTAFGLGRLSLAELAEIEAHVAGCDQCCQALKVLPSDALVLKLRAAAAQPDSPPLVPEELANHPRYHVLEMLGTGGMGAVYKARHRLMDRLVALKVIHPHLTAKPAAVERFRLEAKAAARLAHPNIVTVHDAEQAGDSHFLIMEYLEGISLAKLVAEGGPLPVALACDYVRQAALGLQHAFEHGMVHRDIKPQNLLVTHARGQRSVDLVKILDFGLAQFARDPVVAGPASAADTAPGVPATALTQSGTVMGTPDYIAPEQCTDAHAADIRADIYALGGTLYYLLAGHSPYPEGTVADKLAAQRERLPQSLTALRADVPPQLLRVVERMLAKDPAQRYQTPAEVAAALTPFARESTASPRRRRWLIAAALLVAAAGALSGWFAFREQRPVAPAPAPAQATHEIRRFEGHTGSVSHVAFSADGRRLLSCSNDSTIRLWDVETGQELRCLRGHTGAVQGVAFSPDERRVASCWDGIRLWDLATGKELGRLTGHTGYVWCVAFSPDGSTLVSGSQDNTLRVWDVRGEGKLLHTLTGHTITVWAVAFSPDGRRVLSCSYDKTVRLWDVADGRELRCFTPNPGTFSQVRCVRFSPDGRRFLFGGYDETLRLWDVDSGQELRRFDGHFGWVHGVAFSPDGRRAVSGSWDQTVRLWDVESGQQLHCFEGHKAKVETVAFAPDGRHVASGGYDHKIRLWRVPED